MTGLDPSDAGFDELLQYIESDLGFSTSHYHDPYLDRRISSRMRRCDINTYDEYLTHLRDNPEEQRRLLDAFSINVTSFFRNPSVWEGIRVLLSRLTDVRSGTLRLWSAGCADGREAFSLAMLALATPQIDDRRVEILGTDINPEAIQLATDGIYQDTSLADLHTQLSFLDDYTEYVDIDDTDGTFRVSDEVKELVTFRRHDLLEEPPVANADLVLCRNLMIYIDRESEHQIMENLAASLRRGGFLVVGKTETVRNADNLGFAVLDSGRRVYQYRPDNA